MSDTPAATERIKWVTISDELYIYYRLSLADGNTFIFREETFHDRYGNGVRPAAENDSQCFCHGVSL